MTTASEIEKRLAMTHLTPADPEELKQEIQDQAAEIEKQPGDPKENARLKKEYPFSFSWTDRLGKTWTGNFVNKILSIGDRQGVGVLRAKLSGGIPADSLDPLTTEINLIIAHLTYSLIERPDWAKNLTELDSVPLIQAIYGEVMAHEATFQGYEDITQKGQG